MLHGKRPLSFVVYKQLIELFSVHLWMLRSLCNTTNISSEVLLAFTGNIMPFSVSKLNETPPFLIYAINSLQWATIEQETIYEKQQRERERESEKDDNFREDPDFNNHLYPSTPPNPTETNEELKGKI